MWVAGLNVSPSVLKPDVVGSSMTVTPCLPDFEGEFSVGPKFGHAMKDSGMPLVPNADVDGELHLAQRDPNLDRKGGPNVLGVAGALAGRGRFSSFAGTGGADLCACAHGAGGSPGGAGLEVDPDPQCGTSVFGRAGAVRRQSGEPARRGGFVGARACRGARALKGQARGRKSGDLFLRSAMSLSSLQVDSAFDSAFVPHARLFTFHPSLVSNNSCGATVWVA